MARLVIKGGTGVELSGGPPCVVGRLQSCGLQLKSEPQSSRKHFEVEQKGSRWVLNDLGSRNGTLLNGERVQGSAPLTHGDTIKVGETVVDFESAPPSLTPGSAVGSCRVTSRIGRSDCGTLYAGKQGSLEREVVVEVVDPDLAADPGFRQRYQAHARLAGSFDHPQVQAVYDTSQGSGPLFTIYEACPGKPLSAHMTRTAFDRERSLAVLRQVASGLEHIHARGKRHGGLTPVRVMLDGDRVKLTGAGEQERLRPHRADRPVQAAYASPEEAQGSAPGPAADVYSLGVLAYRLLTGDLPYSGKPGDMLRSHASAEPVPLPSDPQTADFLGALLAKAPSQRPSASDALALIDDLLEGPKSPRRRRKGSARNRKLGRGSSARNRALTDSAARRAKPPAAPARPAAKRPSSEKHVARGASSDRLKAMAPSRNREDEAPDPGGVVALRLLLLGFGYLLIGMAGLLATRIALRLITPA